MAARNLLSTATVNLRELLANGKRYEVPRYQRDYSWTVEHWEDLWSDLEAIAAGERQHYMGALVLQETASSSQFRIIDGQQRIATLSVLVLASLHCLRDMIAAGNQADQNEQRVKLLSEAFLGARDPVTLQTIPKLTLGASNRNFYEHTLLQLRAPASVPSLRDGEASLWRALDFFRARLRSRFPSDGDGAALAQFIYEQIAASLLFIVVSVEDELGAYAVFETLNARGLELSPADLLKNYILSLVHKGGEASLDQAQRTWQDLTERIPSKRLPELLRHHLATIHRGVRSERVFKILREDVRDPPAAFELLKRLDDLSYLAAALDDAHHPLWAEMPSARDSVRALNLFGVTQFRPIVYAAWQLPDTNELLPAILKDLSALSFRYSVIGQLNPNLLEKAYNDIAVRITARELTTAFAVRAELKKVAPADDEFANAFATRALSARSRRRLIMYVLCELERQRYGTDLDFETTTATIEHVLPARGATSYLAFPGDLHDRFVDRLGNYLLLEPKLNRDLGNVAFEDKIARYPSSQYESARQFDFTEWTPRAIEERQRQMAKVATSIWRLP